MKIIYLIIGFISFGLGCIGVVLPILPTTPFFLLTAYCFAKSSKRLHDWFLSTSLYKKHLDSFVKERAMTLQTKISILAFASTMLAFPLIFSDNIYLKIMIICLYIIKYYYFIFRIKTIKSERI
ncbi:MAG: YbaN family protein [Bacilli bacterium]|nr:YbaN family protein [Bacilli bacterium]